MPKSPKKLQALSIMYPAVQNILLGLKTVEIRSWKPPHIPFYNLLLVENHKYLNDGDIDPEGYAFAIVDVVDCYNWSIGMSDINVTLGKEWKEGYYCWLLNNIRPLKTPVKLVAKKGIYSTHLSQEILK